MRKIIVSTYVSLDGVMKDPQNWSGQFWNAEHEQYAHDLLFGADTLLLGRETYESFAVTWPNRTATDDRPANPFADRINGMAKYVASTTLKEPLHWNNSHLIKGDVVEAVAKLKQQPGRDIVMYGAGPLAHTLLLNGLIDDFRVWLHPIVVGKGEQLLNGATDVPIMKLVDTQTFSSGVVVLSYAPQKA